MDDMENRGGKRPGSGRPPKPENEKRVKLWISCKKHEAEKIQTGAAAAGKTTSEYILEKLDIR